jgi:hypothetical protein
MRVSHETIYLSLFVQSRGALRRELQHCLRTGRAMRYPRGKRLPQGRGQLRDTLHISQRPAEVPMVSATASVAPSMQVRGWNWSGGSAAVRSEAGRECSGAGLVGPLAVLAQMLCHNG